MNDLCFNQDFSCLSVSTAQNHRIFNCDPFGEFYSSAGKAADAGSSGTSLLRMLFSTSLTIIVPEKSGHRVLRIFNLKQNLKICELTFPSSIVDVRLNRKRLVVFLELGQIYIYDLSSVRLVKVLEIDSYTHTDGKTEAVVADLRSDDHSFLVLPLSVVNESTDLFDSADSDSELAADSATSLAPYIELTQKNEQAQLAKKPLATLKDLQKDSGGWVLVYDIIRLKPRLIYKAHDSAIAKIAVSSEGNYIATASTKGTIIRVSHINEDTLEAEKLEITQVTNLRRGHNPAKINALKFSLDSAILGCGSESGTVHLFALSSKHEKHTDPSEAEDGDFDNHSDDEPATRLSSSEDLNENLANLLISKESETKGKEEHGSYFSALKPSSKLINNSYTKSLMKRLPYKQYLKNLIWEKPRRSFAYVKLPECDGHSPKRVEIGFSSAGLVMLASYNSGKLYQYQMPDVGAERTECKLVLQDSLV